MPTDAKPTPGSAAIPPEILDAAIGRFLQELDRPADPLPVAAPKPVLPVASEAAEPLVATHPDPDEWAAMKKEEQGKLQSLLNPADPLTHVPVIEVREGGSTDEGIAGDDWHTAAEESTTNSPPVPELGSADPDEE